MMSSVSAFLADAELFLKDFVPLGTMMSRAFIYSFSVVLVSLGAFWLEERIEAHVRMRPPRPLKQTVAQVISLLLKRPRYPASGRKGVFILSPVLACLLGLFFFFFLPVDGFYFLRPDFSLLYLLFASSLGMYAFITGGWSSGTRFSFFGAVRLTAQTISCQAVLAFVVMTILMTAGDSNLIAVMQAQKGLWFVVPHFPLFVLYLLCCAMILAQAPFGAPKSERELAGGIYAEYSGALHLLFLAAEKIFQLLFAAAGAVLFLGGSLPAGGITFIPPFLWLFLKTALILFILTVLKAALPVYKTDKVMRLSFKFYLPFSLMWMIATAGILLFVQGGF